MQRVDETASSVRPNPAPRWRSLAHCTRPLVLISLQLSLSSLLLLPFSHPWRALTFARSLA